MRLLKVNNIDKCPKCGAIQIAHGSFDDSAWTVYECKTRVSHYDTLKVNFNRKHDYIREEKTCLRNQLAAAEKRAWVAERTAELLADDVFLAKTKLDFYYEEKSLISLEERGTFSDKGRDYVLAIAYALAEAEEEEYGTDN